MLELTRDLVSVILEKDPAVSPDQRARVLAVLEDAPDPALECSEREAAALLGVSSMTMVRWRLGRRPVRFPFTVRMTPAGCARYVRAEVLAERAAQTRSAGP